MKKKALVAGALGVIGRSLIQELEQTAGLGNRRNLPQGS
jgi:nucleoside-diphosphate-sugar epimerase